MKVVGNFGGGFPNWRPWQSNALFFKKNPALRALDVRVPEQAVRAGTKDTLLFADRFPFRYFVEGLWLKVLCGH